MDEMKTALAAAFTEKTYKVVLSAPIQKTGAQKLTFSRKENGFQAERRVGAQAFHENLTEAEAFELIQKHLGAEFRQCNAWDGEFEHMVRISKSGKAFYTKNRVERMPKKEEAHDREKEYLLKEGGPTGPLVEMGVFTPDGRVVKSMYDKYKQINRFLEIVDDALSSYDPKKPLTAVDFGCGKSYLTFVLYHYFKELRGFENLDMTGLDLKKDVIGRCNLAAEKFGYESLHFELGDIRGYKPDKPIDMVVSLHACDTATDYAINGAVDWGANYIFSVPCCQHELNAQMNTANLPILTRYGIIKERAAALFTDAIRANLLTACGYKTQVLEFVDLSHTPKNLLLRAVKTNLPKETRREALHEAEALMKEFHLNPALYVLLAGKITV
ncbi:MAG TPA: SAM-dependent methyltransferase [Clostridia bacterium]|nr:SAM-dependent methyltransferase [Clostridia bacterium]